MQKSIHDVLAAIPKIDEFDEAGVLEKIHLVDTDILVLSGSLVDGSGTPSSDFDFCVIAEKEDGRFHRRTFPRDAHMRYYTSDDRVKASFDYLPDSLLGVDVEYRTVTEVLRMLEAHAKLYRYMTGRARKSSSFAAASVDFRFLSRLTYGVALRNDEAFREIQKEVRAEEIAYTAFRTSVGSYPDFRDLAGMWVQGDHDGALVAARKLAVDTFRGLTHAYGNTNRNPKYLTRFLARLPGSLDDLVTRFGTMLVGDREVAGGSAGAVLAWLDLVDAAFAEIRQARGLSTAFPTAEDFLATLRGELHETMRWNAEISNEYCFRAREAIDGLPSLRDILSAMERRAAPPHRLPLREWAAGRPAPRGENNKSDS